VQTVGPITSHYRWKGKIERGREWLMLIKTRPALLRRLEAEVLEQHPYDVPEILVLPVHSGHDAYMRWLLRECAFTARRGGGKD
jgi:periplasmic divalent cation tolerance protein